MALYDIGWHIPNQFICIETHLKALKFKKKSTMVKLFTKTLSENPLTMVNLFIKEPEVDKKLHAFFYKHQQL